MIGILHNIRSLYNVGAIFRTADGVGMSKLYLCGYTPTPVNKFGFADLRLAKTALGAQEYVDWEKVGTITDHSSKATIALLERLKQNGFTIYAIEQTSNAIVYSDITITEKEFEKTALVVGPEVEGLSDDIVAAADQVLEVPMLGKKNSLNVSVTFGIVAYQLRMNQ